VGVSGLLDETDTELVAAGAEVGVLVLQRRGIGTASTQPMVAHSVCRR
jgi:hypothetical protein